jgi:hypothetical protein
MRLTNAAASVLDNEPRSDQAAFRSFNRTGRSGMSHAPCAARLLIAEAWVERSDDRAELPILHLIARRLTNRSDLLYGRLGRADDVTHLAPACEDATHPRLPLRAPLGHPEFVASFPEADVAGRLTTPAGRIDGYSCPTLVCA